MTNEQMILSRLDSIERLLRKLLVPSTLLSPADNDFLRAEQAALAARDKSRAKKALKGWDYSKV